MYGFEYDDDAATDEDITPLVFNVQVHIIAEKYDAPRLQKIAEEGLAKRVQLDWKTAAFANAIELATRNAQTTNVIFEIVL